MSNFQLSTPPWFRLLASLAWIVATTSYLVSLSRPYPLSSLFSTHWPRSQIISLIYSVIRTRLCLLVSLRVKFLTTAQIPFYHFPFDHFISATLATCWSTIHTPASGALHWLFPLPHFQYPQGSLHPHSSPQPPSFNTLLKNSSFLT